MKSNYVSQLMNAKFNGDLPPPQNIQNFALQNAEFTRQWLCHAVSSSNSPQELAIVLCLAKYHKIEALNKLIYFWPKSNVGENEAEGFLKCLASLPLDAQQFDDELVNLWFSLQSPLVIQPNSQLSPVKITESILTKELANEVICVASKNLNLAAVYTEQSVAQRVKKIRDNEQLITQLPVDNILFAILQRIMCADDYADLAYAEPMVVYRYQEGQQYKWHYDFITASNEAAKKELDFFGQRMRTRIINLNDGFEGGETAFKNWDISVKPKQGQVITFDNMHDGKVNEQSVHSGKPVLSGEKWICTLWMREKPFWLRESIWYRD